MYIPQYASSNEIFEYSYPHSNAQVTFLLKTDCENVVCCANVQRLSTALNRSPAAYIHFSANEKRRYILMSSLWQYIAVYRRIYCRKFMTLSNQTSRFICKCIRICLLTLFLAKSSEFTVLDSVASYTGKRILTISMLGNFSCFFVVICWFFFFKVTFFSKNSSRNSIRVSNIWKRALWGTFIGLNKIFECKFVNIFLLISFNIIC